MEETMGLSWIDKAKMLPSFQGENYGKTGRATGTAAKMRGERDRRIFIAAPHFVAGSILYITLLVHLECKINNLEKHRVCDRIDQWQRFFLYWRHIYLPCITYPRLFLCYFRVCLYFFIKTLTQKWIRNYKEIQEIHHLESHCLGSSFNDICSLASHVSY